MEQLLVVIKTLPVAHIQRSHGLAEVSIENALTAVQLLPLSNPASSSQLLIPKAFPKKPHLCLFLLSLLPRQLSLADIQPL